MRNVCWLFLKAKKAVLCVFFIETAAYVRLACREFYVIKLCGSLLQVLEVQQRTISRVPVPNFNSISGKESLDFMSNPQLSIAYRYELTHGTCRLFSKLLRDT